MKIASLALATALAAMVGSAQPTLAQSSDKSGGSDENQSQDAPRMHQQQQDQGSDHDRDWQSRSGRHHRSLAEGGPIGRRPAAGTTGRTGRCDGVQFHFARGDRAHRHSNLRQTKIWRAASGPPANSSTRS